MENEKDTLVNDENTTENIQSENEVTQEAEKNEESVLEENISPEEEAKEFISEFAPEPIQIPNYNKEKEQRKHEKTKKKKKNSKKRKKRRKLLRKVVNIIKTIVLFMFLLALTFVTLSSLLVRLNTTEFAVETSIKENEPEKFVVGRILYPDKLELQRSAEDASVADILRDNIMPSTTVTYAQIEREVRKSTYPKFVADVAHKVISYYIYGEEYKSPTREELSEVFVENASSIYAVTGRQFGQTIANEFAEYMSSSRLFSELKETELEKQAAAKYTYITSVLFSFPVLIGMIVLLIFLLVLTIVSCNGYAHKMIGSILMLSGIATGVIGVLFKPMYKSTTFFSESVVRALTNSLHTSSVIFGAVVFAIGLLVLLIGSSMADYDEDDDEDYIEEIEPQL